VTGLSVTAQTATTLTASWSNPSPSAGTVVNDTVFLYDTGGCSTVSSVYNPAAVITSYQETGLSNALTYCIGVEVWTQGGGSHLTFTNGTTENGPPSAPTGLMETTASRTTISISWTQPSGVLVNDTVYYKLGSSCGAGMTGLSASVTTTYTIGSLTAADQYSIEVTAWTSGGQSPDSSCLTTGTQGATPPAPVDLEITPSVTTATLTWQNPAGYTLANDTVYITAAGGSCPTWAHTYSTGGVVESYELTGLTPASSYCVEVAAWDNESPLSAPLMFDSDPPSTSPNVTISSVTSTSFDETWSNGTWANVTYAVLSVAYSDAACEAVSADQWSWAVYTYAAFIPQTDGLVGYAFNTTTMVNDTFTASETLWVGLSYQAGAFDNITACQEVHLSAVGGGPLLQGTALINLLLLLLIAAVLLGGVWSVVRRIDR
jgi:hypothetical protein